MIISGLDTTERDDLIQRLEKLRSQKLEAYRALAECRRYEDEEGAQRAHDRLYSLSSDIAEIEKELT